MATWSSSYVTALPDSAFACVDDSGRHYPHHDAQGKLDMPHLRNAMSRIGDASNAQCGKAHLEAHARSAGIGEAKADAPLKATPIDDDAFLLLALPFGGPIPFPGAPKGADLDRQWMTERTDFGSPPKQVDVTWHHGADPAIGREVIGKAGELYFDDDGGWVTVWLDRSRRNTRLIAQLAKAAEDDPEAGVYGSSEAVRGSGRLKLGQYESSWRPKVPGEITRWWYSGQTLSAAPRNNRSILMPVKATLEDLSSGEYDATPAFFDDLARWLDDLAPDPAPTLAARAAGDGEAKAGRILASRNEARLREAISLLDGPYDASFQLETKRRKQAIDALKHVLDELDRSMRPIEL